MRLPIRARLTAWYALFLITILVALGAFLVLKLRSDLRSTVDREVRASSGAIAENFSHEGVAGFREISTATLRRSGDTAQILTPTGRVLASYGGDLAQDPMISAARRRAALAGTPQLFQVDLGDSEAPYRLMATGVQHRQNVRVLVVAVSLQGESEAVGKILLLLLIAGPIALAIAALAAWWLVRNALQPVDRMRRKAERIGIDQLHERLAAPNPSDEVGQLAATLNAMLDRLEAGVTAKRQLIADASHELRTPLAAMRAELDVSLRQGHHSAAARTALESVRAEVDQMTRTVNNLLTLARADEGRLQLMQSEFDLRTAADAAARSLQPLADAKHLRLVVTGPECLTEGDPDRIRQAIMNLIENAIEFTPADGQVTVSSWRESEEIGITVADTGAGIPPEERDRVFDRFYRVDPSRSRQSGGSGLGLAICFEIAAAHGGRVWLDSENGQGSAFSIAFPAPLEAGGEHPQPAPAPEPVVSDP